MTSGRALECLADDRGYTPYDVYVVAFQDNRWVPAGRGRALWILRHMTVQELHTCPVVLVLDDWGDELERLTVDDLPTLVELEHQADRMREAEL